MHPHFPPPDPPCPTGKSLRVPPLGALFGTDSEPLSPTRSAGGDPSAQPLALTRSSDGGATSSSGQGVEGVDGVAESLSTGGSGLGGILRMGRGQSRSGGRSTSMPGTFAFSFVQNHWSLPFCPPSLIRAAQGIAFRVYWQRCD